MGTLIIGNKNYSSWSMRPWVLLKEKGIPFNEQRIPLHTDISKTSILKISPSGKVPAFVDDDGMVLWDSLAICEYIAERYPDKGCWPADTKQRALARSVSNEMHSGFQTIRTTLFMNCRMQMVYKDISPKLQVELDRVRQIWRDCRSKTPDGPFLFGKFSIADAMYAPMTIRFHTYGIETGQLERDYINTILSLDAVKQWMEQGKAETEVLAQYEVARNDR